MYAIVDIWKLIGMLLIMAHHITIIGVSGEYIFKSAWIYVELFFIFTGYFTVKHFSLNIGNDCVDAAVKYTIKKFKVFLPYSTIGIVLTYIIKNGHLLKEGIKPFIAGFAEIPFELLLVVSSFSDRRPLMAPLWYLSAMFVVFPLFCCFVQMKHRNLLYLLSANIAMFYYGYIGVATVRTYPHDLLRAFSCMSLGVFIYSISEHMKKYIFKRWVKIFLTIVEEGCLVFVIFSTYNNWPIMRINLFCFVIAVSIIFSNQSYSQYIRSGIVSLISRITMPLFLIHWGIGCYIGMLKLPLQYKIFIYYIASILCAVVCCLAVEFFRKRIKDINKYIFEI